MYAHLPLKGGSAEGWSTASTSIRTWEPALDLWREEDVPRLYEPAGTLYAVCLSSTRLSTDRRVVDVTRGDLIIVPQAVAIDVETPVDLLCLSHNGVPPFHFRERFIQIWGFEKIGAEEAQDPLRTGEHRFTYQVLDLNPGQNHREPAGLDIRIVLVLTGGCNLSRVGETEVEALNVDNLCILGAEEDFQLHGQGRLGVLTIPTELLHEYRLRQKHLLKPPSPDYPVWPQESSRPD